MAIIIFLGIGRSSLRDRIDEYNQKKLNAICDEYLLRIFKDHMIIWNRPARWIVFEGLKESVMGMDCPEQVLLTVLSKEQRTDRTTCLSGQVAIYVMALTPTTGSMFALVYIALDVRVSSNRNISERLLSNSLLVPTGVLQPTPLCHIAYETLFFPVGGNVKPPKNNKSMRVSISSSASGLASSYLSSGDCGLFGF
jgi:hypothetical protein